MIYTISKWFFILEKSISSDLPALETFYYLLNHLRNCIFQMKFFPKKFPKFKSASLGNTNKNSKNKDVNFLLYEILLKSNQNHISFYCKLRMFRTLNRLNHFHI